MRFYENLTINMLPPTVIPLEMEIGNRQKTVPPSHKSDRTEPELHTPMKTNPSLLRHLAATAALLFTAATAPSFAQTTATTDPVGFITLVIGGGGVTGAPVYTFTSLGLLNPVLFQSTTTSVGGDTTLVDANATWTDNLYNTNGTDPSHFVEILSGPGAGTQYDITGTIAATHTLNLGDPLLAGIASGASYRIRPHWTLATVFGDTNQNGLASGSVTSADQVQLFRNQGYTTYYYQTVGLGGTGWRKAGGVSGTDAKNAVIYPDDGILIARQQSAPVSLVISGAVKTGQTSIPVVSGYSLLGNVYAAGMTLANSNLYTGNSATGLAPGSVTSADQVMFWNGTGFTSYYYQTIGLGGTGWRQAGGVSGTDASATPIPVGAALFIQRAGAPFNWVAPQTPASF